jgi:hypothetical protein
MPAVCYSRSGMTAMLSARKDGPWSFSTCAGVIPCLVWVLAIVGCGTRTTNPTKPVAIPTATVSVTPATVAPGESAVLEWQTANAARVSIAGIGDVAGSGSQKVAPQQTTTYALSASGSGGTVGASATVTVSESTVPLIKHLLMHPLVGLAGPGIAQTSPPTPQTTQNGTITYDPPQVVTLAVPVTIDAAVTRPTASGQAFVPTQAEAQSLGLTSGQPLTSQSLPVSDEMIVTLRAATAGAFAVSPDETDTSNATKAVPPGGHAEWHWTVTPNMAGKQTLVLHSMFVIHMADGSTVPSDQGSFETTIAVQVLPWYTRAWQAIVSALFGNWVHIVSWSGPIVLGAIFTWWKKRKGQKKE